MPYHFTKQEIASVISSLLLATGAQTAKTQRRFDKLLSILNSTHIKNGSEKSILTQQIPADRKNWKITSPSPHSGNMSPKNRIIAEASFLSNYFQDDIPKDSLMFWTHLLRCSLFDIGSSGKNSNPILSILLDPEQANGIFSAILCVSRTYLSAPSALSIFEIWAQSQIKSYGDDFLKTKKAPQAVYDFYHSLDTLNYHGAHGDRDFIYRSLRFLSLFHTDTAIKNIPHLLGLINKSVAYHLKNEETACLVALMQAEGAPYNNDPLLGDPKEDTIYSHSFPITDIGINALTRIIVENGYGSSIQKKNIEDVFHMLTLTSSASSSRELKSLIPKSSTEEYNDADIEALKIENKISRGKQAGHISDIVISGGNLALVRAFSVAFSAYTKALPTTLAMLGSEAFTKCLTEEISQSRTPYNLDLNGFAQPLIQMYLKSQIKDEIVSSSNSIRTIKNKI